MDKIITFSKQITRTTITEKIIDNSIDILKVLEVVAKLENQQSVGEMYFDEIGLRTNPKKWITKALDNFPDSSSGDIQNLLFDFTDSMQTRMREDSKHALGLLMNNKLLLCHSKYGEKTITPEWKIIPRMLDIDNVLRFATFSRKAKNPQKIIVKYWERSSTNSFIDWLGLPKKQAFLFGGKYRLLTIIEGINIEFQFTEEEIEQWINSHPEFKDGEIRFSKPINSSVIDEIRMGSRHYKDPVDFIQDYEAEKFGVHFYVNEYEKLKKEKLPLLMKYFDEESQVVRVEGDELSIVVQKNTDNFHIIFADKDVELRNHYLKVLEKEIINGKEVNVFHVGENFKSEFVKIDNVRIYNEVVISNLTDFLIRYLNGIQQFDPDLRRIFLHIVFSLLAMDNKNHPIEILFKSLSDELIQKLSFSKSFTTGEDDLIEYKSRDIIKTTAEIIEYFMEDISVKLRKNRCKFYIIGVEDNGRIDPIPSNRLNGDRIEEIRKGIANQLSDININLQPIGESELILILSAVKA